VNIDPALRERPSLFLPFSRISVRSSSMMVLCEHRMRCYLSDIQTHFIFAADWHALCFYIFQYSNEVFPTLQDEELLRRISRRVRPDRSFTGDQ
jgi:hypothetical protein